MKNIFSPDSFLMRALTLFYDIMCLNALFLICSIPIFTAGASATALYSLIFKRIRGEEFKIGKTFFAEFKANFKQATLFWVPYILIIAFLIADVYISHNFLEKPFSYLQYPASIMIFVIVFTTILVFPQMALFKSKTKQIIKNSILLSIVNFPIVFMVLALHFLIFLIADLSAKCTVVVGSLLVFFGFAGLAYFFSLFYRKIFLKALGDKAENEDEEPVI